MTLCKYRPRRTYDAQYIFEENDVRGLMKKLESVVAEMGEDGLAETPYYTGALVAFGCVFDAAKRDGEVDIWLDFPSLFADGLRERTGE